MRRWLRLLAITAAAGLVASAATVAGAGPQHAPLAGRGEGLKLVANIKYSGGTDMEFGSHKGRHYAFTGSSGEDGALRVIDITKPAKPKLAATMKCNLNQSDIQISHDGKTLIMAQDDPGGNADACLMFAKAGFMTVDISNPLKPKPIGRAEISRGSHNTTAHPTKPFVYNSDADLQRRGEIQIWSIKNPAKPKLVNTVDSLPHSPHDISFNKKGTLAVTASISHFDLWDTSDPANPTLLYTGQCPGCSITHDAKFTPDGKGLVIGDEGGGGRGYPCPGGALYFYQLQGPADHPIPVMTGVFEPAEFVKTENSGTLPGGCTSHVFGFSPNGKQLAISWYTAGTHYVDFGDLMGFAIGGNNAGNIDELGYFLPEGGNTWSSKFYKDPRYIFSNDLNRGFDVFEITKR